MNTMISYSLDTECVVDKVQYRKIELQNPSLREMAFGEELKLEIQFSGFWKFSFGKLME